MLFRRGPERPPAGAAGHRRASPRGEHGTTTVIVTFDSQLTYGKAQFLLLHVFLLVDEAGPTPFKDITSNHSVGNQSGQIGTEHVVPRVRHVQQDSVTAGPQLVVYVIFLLHLICRHNDIKVNHALRDSADGRSPP